MAIKTFWNSRDLLLHYRWPWHLLFWLGYILFRFWPYYITVVYYPSMFLEFMLLSEILFIAITYFTIFLYRLFFETKKYKQFFLLGGFSWLLYLCLKTAFQFYYLQNEINFRSSKFTDAIINSITVTLVSFLFITACKFFKDGYIRQHFEAERRGQQLLAEVNNLKSQIAPHFLFNTLNNLYGLAVEKSEKLPGLMLRLSDLLRHSLYETQKPAVPLVSEIVILKSYIELESIRLEDNLQLQHEDTVPPDDPHLIAPLILIVFIENAFKHAKRVQSEPVYISVNTSIINNWFQLRVQNNYKPEKKSTPHGIGLTNVIRRLEVLYPDSKHQLRITNDNNLFTVDLGIQLIPKN